MPWNLVASGECPDSVCEGWFLDRLADLIFAPDVAVSRVRMSTDFHGELSTEQLKPKDDGLDYLPPGMS